jgi:hypothetical protein
MNESEKWELDGIKSDIERDYWLSPTGKKITYEGDPKSLMNKPWRSIHLEIARQMYPGERDPESLLKRVGCIKINPADGYDVKELVSATKYQLDHLLTVKNGSHTVTQVQKLKSNKDASNAK